MLVHSMTASKNLMDELISTIRKHFVEALDSFRPFVFAKLAAFLQFPTAAITQEKKNEQEKISVFYTFIKYHNNRHT